MLSTEILEKLVAKRNEEGKKHTVEVMTKEQLIEYRENCTQAIERLERTIAKYRNGGVVQMSLIENKEMIEGFIAYIDEHTKEEDQAPKEEKGMAVIDAFIGNWKTRAFNHYMGLKQKYTDIRSADYPITAENLKVITDAWGKRTYTDEQIEKILIDMDQMPAYKIDGLKKSIRYGKTKAFKYFLSKHEIALLDRMYGTEEQRASVLMNHLTKDAESRKVTLIARVEKKAGKIIDASGLYMGSDLEINGVIVGDQNTVKVQTITAGGHSIQIAHYRVLVNVKKK
jgi:hypothetical protein